MAALVSADLNPSMKTAGQRVLSFFLPFAEPQISSYKEFTTRSKRLSCKASKMTLFIRADEGEKKKAQGII